jgi:hypothetical protein
MSRARMHTRESAIAALRAGGTLHLYKAIYSDPASASIRDAHGHWRTVRYRTAVDLPGHLKMVENEHARSCMHRQFYLGGVA